MSLSVDVAQRPLHLDDIRDGRLRDRAPWSARPCVGLIGSAPRSRVIAFARAVIGERFDYSALAGGAGLAGRRDALEFTLQRPQLRDARVHIIEMAPGDVIGFFARAVRMIRQVKQ